MRATGLKAGAVLLMRCCFLATDPNHPWFVPADCCAGKKQANRSKTDIPAEFFRALEFDSSLGESYG